MVDITRSTRHRAPGTGPKKPAGDTTSAEYALFYSACRLRARYDTYEFLRMLVRPYSSSYLKGTYGICAPSLPIITISDLARCSVFICKGELRYF